MGSGQSTNQTIIASGGKHSTAIREMKFVLSYKYKINEEDIRAVDMGDTVQFMVMKSIEEEVIDDGFSVVGEKCDAGEQHCVAAVVGTIRDYIVWNSTLTIIEIDPANSVDLSVEKWK